MSIVDKAIQTQLTNIQAKTGQTLAQLRAVLQRSGLTKHGEIRAMFQRDLGLGYGDANMLTRALRDTDAEGTTGVQAAARHAHRYRFQSLLEAERLASRKSREGRRPPDHSSPL